LEGPWAENVPHSEIQEIFNDWGRDARIIIDHMENPSRWSIHFLEPPLKSYVNGKVVLVGDAVCNSLDVEWDVAIDYQL